MAEDDEPSEVFTPQKSSLSRKAIEKNALRKSAVTTAASNLPIRNTGLDPDRPTYSKSYLEELRNSTPSTPQPATGPEAEGEDFAFAETFPSSLNHTGPSQDLDVSSKFGPLTTSVSFQSASLIPSEAEIREKKARRARLAKEQQYISLHSRSRSNSSASVSNSEHSSGSSSESEKHTTNFVSANASPPPTSSRRSHRRPTRRLARDDFEDDEDIAEGPRNAHAGIQLTQKGAREARRVRKAAIGAQIADAEASGAEDSSEDEDVERRREYDAAQTRKGMEGIKRGKDEDEQEGEWIRVPPRITPLPTFEGWFARYSEKLAGMQANLKAKREEMETITKELDKVRARESEIKVLLDDAGRRYAQVAKEAGIEIGAEDSVSNGVSSLPSRLGYVTAGQGRGLEGWGGGGMEGVVEGKRTAQEVLETQEANSPEERIEGESEEDDEYGEEGEMPRRGLGA